MLAAVKVFKRSLSLLKKEEQRRLFLLSILVFFMSFMELFGVASILPFMGVATNPDLIHQNTQLSWMYENFGFSSQRLFLVFLGVMSLLMLVLGNVFRAFSSYLLLNFAQMQNHYLAERVLSSYLHQPYEFFLTQNGSDLTKNVLGEVGQLVNGLYVPALRAFGRGCTALVIVVVLITFNPVIAGITSLVLFTFYYLIYKVLKKIIQNLGTSRVVANQQRYRIVNEASGGIKEVKLMNKEEVYLKDFTRPSKKFARIQAQNSVIGDFPRYILEIAAFGGMLGIVIFLISTEGQDKAISLASFYAFAGYKLMPALQEIFAAVTKIKFTLPVLELVERSLRPFREIKLGNEVGKICLIEQIEFKDVSFRYSGSAKSALNDINIVIKAKSTVGVIGPTGSGKTTFVDLLLGLLKPSSGKILIDGVELGLDNLSGWQKNIGYVPQNIYLSDDTIERNIAFGIEKDNIDTLSVKKAARLAQLDEFIENELPDSYQTSVGERGVRLSGGQRQRVGIARALYHDPSLLVFDEATSALDNDTESAFMNAVLGLGGEKTIIMIAHRLSTLKRADKVLKITDGRIVDEVLPSTFTS